MSITMLKNYIGLEVTDEEMKDIPNPRLELYTHVTYKTVQFGTFVGTVVIGPVVNFFKGPQTLPAYTNRMLRSGSKGLIIGIPLGPILAYAVSRKDSPERNYDRCYRLRHNKSQLTMDRMTSIGGLLGLCGSGVMGVTSLQGMSLGIVSGVISSIFVTKFR